MHSKERDFIFLNTREKTIKSGWENAPDGNAALSGDADSVPSNGEPAGEGHDFFFSVDATGDRFTSRQIHKCIIFLRAKAKGTAASYQCSLDSRLPIFTKHHCLSDDPMIFIWAFRQHMLYKATQYCYALALLSVSHLITTVHSEQSPPESNRLILTMCPQFHMEV